ncbi:uncharacterized protein P884DRAFT_31992 [Thermothelomyces heterothallicus CBS 202.75]|uniref:uncharacterized protein n=1 Tax=Thermothelomyces heterothallicus CBS 202.75 TaxID=1149848 RepID=UPI00374230C7
MGRFCIRILSVRIPPYQPPFFASPCHHESLIRTIHLPLLAASLPHIPSRDSRCATHHQHQTATLPYASARNIRSTARSRHPQPSPSPAATQLDAGPKRAKPATEEEASRHPFGLGKVGRSRIANGESPRTFSLRATYTLTTLPGHTMHTMPGGMVSVWQNDTQFMHSERDITPHTLDTFWLRKQGKVSMHPPQSWSMALFF